MKDAIRQEGLRLGFDAVGFCTCDPPSSYSAYLDWLENGFHGTMGYMQRHAPQRAGLKALLPGVKTVIAVRANYNQPNPRRPGRPHIARYALGRDYHKVVRSRLKRLGAFVSGLSPSQQFRVCVDSAPVLEREFAHRAGLGWFGKNTMLIDSKSGSWFVIGLLLTTAEVEPDEPAQGGCGTCKKCVEACPTGAIVKLGGRWQVDARRCVSYLTIEHKGDIAEDLQSKLDGWTFGCDVCQEVCPFNEERANQPMRAQRATITDFLHVRDWPPLKELETIEQSQWDVLTRGSPVRRTGLDSLRRNAHVGLTKPRGKT